MGEQSGFMVEVHDGLKTNRRTMICQISGHKCYPLHESFSLAKNEMSVIRVIRG
jgi:hypothetical protein